LSFGIKLELRPNVLGFWLGSGYDFILTGLCSDGPESTVAQQTIP